MKFGVKDDFMMEIRICSRNDQVGRTTFFLEVMSINYMRKWWTTSVHIRVADVNELVLK